MRRFVVIEREPVDKRSDWDDRHDDFKERDLYEGETLEDIGEFIVEKAADLDPERDRR